MCVHMCAFVYVTCIYLCAQESVYVCMYVCVHACVLLCKRVRVYACVARVSVTVSSPIPAPCPVILVSYPTKRQDLSIYHFSSISKVVCQNKGVHAIKGLLMIFEAPCQPFSNVFLYNLMHINPWPGSWYVRYLPLPVYMCANLVFVSACILQVEA